MKNRGHVGVLALAGLVSLSAIGVAFMTTRNEDTATEQSNGIVAAAPKSESAHYDALASWRETLEQVAPAPSEDGGTYVAPRALPTTDALAREIFAVYAKARSDGEFQAGEVESGIAQVIDQNTPELESVAKYARADVRAEADVNLAGYENAVMSTLREASVVREYELNVFARAISSNSAVELKKLEATALVYENISKKLMTLDVPEALVDNHLQVVNDLSGIAASVRGLSRWGGDPLDALVLVNEFTKRESRFAQAMNDFNTIVGSLKKQSS